MMIKILSYWRFKNLNSKVVQIISNKKLNKITIKFKFNWEK